VLPLPVANVADDAVEFLDFSKARDIFTTLAQMFPTGAERMEQSLGIRALGAVEKKPLVVHDVGSFEASYVPALGDMDRLDKRFRISDKIWNALPQYVKSGFAVFKLKPGKHTIHPMAMKFTTSEPESLFFPTVHVHDGTLHATARFDHVLYLQAEMPPKTEVERARSGAVAIDHTHGAVRHDQPVFRKQLHGQLPNADTRVVL
jgi:hypothetical protein